MKEEIMLLKIHNALKEGKDYYEAVHGNWKIDKRRFDYIQYVAGINQGKVVCEFQPSKWHIVEEGPEKEENTLRAVKLQKKCYQNCNVLKRNCLKSLGVEVRLLIFLCPN